MDSKIVRGESYTLYLGDCLDIMPTLGNVDAVVSDPPYGIGESSNNNSSRGKLAIAKDYGRKSWDNSTADKEIELAVKISDHQIIFGGNYYRLPPSSCWLVWDKENGASDFADIEMAWTNLKKAARLKRYLWNGMLRANGEKRGDHPTQKPIGIMEWCLSFIPDSQIILDPFMGSGTTGVACARSGRKFIGIEKDPEYFEIACQRVQNAYGDFTLTNAEKEAGQMPLFG